MDNKDDFLRCAQAEALRIIEESPDKWAAREYPLRYDTEFEGQNICIEVSQLHQEKDYCLRIAAYECRQETGQNTTNFALIPLSQTLRFLSRAEAIRRARTIASQIETSSYEEWSGKKFPVTYETNYDGHRFQVEIEALGSKDDNLILQVAIYDSGVLAYSPATAPAFLERPEPMPQPN